MAELNPNNPTVRTTDQRDYPNDPNIYQDRNYPNDPLRGTEVPIQTRYPLEWQLNDRTVALVRDLQTDNPHDPGYVGLVLIRDGDGVEGVVNRKDLARVEIVPSHIATGLLISEARKGVKLAPVQKPKGLVLQKYNGRIVTWVRPSREGDPSYDASKSDQVVVRYEDNTEATCLKSQITSA